MGLIERLDDSYEIVAKIKEGGMGEIYKVRHRLLDEIRVVKVLHPELVGDSELAKRFALEARAAIQLRHPNIVQIFDFTVDDSGTGLIIMEYIEGTDLKQLVAQPRLPSIALSIEIACQGLRALGFLHRHGFVHRDVSPDNLMLSSDVEGRPLVKVIDLGIVKRRGSDLQLTASGMFLGKFRYASPEHFGAQGSGAVEARSDLYTFGLVLYELLTGHYPIRGETTSQLIAGHLFQPPSDFAETDPEHRVPEQLRRAVLKILAKEPSERFATAEELAAELRILQADYPLSDEVLEESRRFAVDAGAPEPDSDPGATSGSGAAFVPSRAESGSQASGSIPQAGKTKNGETKISETKTGETMADFEALVHEVDTLLDSGRLMEADRVLFQVRETYGPAPELTTARERLGALYQSGVESGVRELVARATDLARSGDQPRALDVLDKARAAAPARSPLRREVEAAAEDLRRQPPPPPPPSRTIDEVERELVASIQEQELTTAKRLMAEAEAELGSDPDFEPLRRLLARTLEERIQDLVKQAGIAYEAERFDAATDHLSRVLELDPGNSWIREQLKRSHESHRRQREEARREQLRSSEIEAVEEALAANDLETATKRLDAAVTRLGAHVAFTELSDRIDIRRQDAQVDFLVRQAEEARKKKDFLKARLLIAEALELRPGHGSAEALAKALDQEHRAAELQPSALRTTPLSPGLMKAYTDIEMLRVKGDSLAAWRSLLEAIEQFGEIDTLMALRRQIAEEILND